MHIKLTDPIDPAIQNAKHAQTAHLLHLVAISIALVTTLFYGSMLLVLPAHALRWLLTLVASYLAVITMLFLVRSGALWLARVAAFLLVWGVVTAPVSHGGRNPLADLLRLFGAHLRRRSILR